MFGLKRATTTTNPVKHVVHHVRRFEAAIADRLTASWRGTNNSIDQELRGDLDRLRARSLDLFKNNEYARRFGSLARNNIVGPEGFKLHARAVDPNGKLDTLANKAIEQAFEDWSRPGNCDVRGQRSFADICRGVVDSLSSTGEYLIRRVRGAGRYGYQLQLLNPARIDTSYNRAPTSKSNAVIMGVEVDSHGKPVAYHLLMSVGTAGFWGSRTRERVPANEIFHGFIPMEPEQTRGVPWLHAAMRILNDLKGYREAAVIAARLGASKMGVWETPDGGPPPGAENDPTGEGEGGDGAGKQYITEADPGHFDYAPPGYKLNTYDPAYPHDQFDVFCKATLRGIASAACVSYHSLANDLTDVNFSSIRSGTLEEREEWMAIQNVIIGKLLIPLFEEWLDMGLLRGAILMPNGSALPAAKRDKFARHKWQGRRWQWVDPLKDVQSAVIAIRNGLASPQQIAMQAGRSIEDIVDDLAAFNELLKSKNIELPYLGDAGKTGASSASGSTCQHQENREEVKRFALSVSVLRRKVRPA